MATLVINVSRVPQQVGLILANGKKATTRIMHRSRAYIEEGAKIDPEWAAHNPGVIKTVEEDALKVAQIASTTKTNTAQTVGSAGEAQ